MHIRNINEINNLIGRGQRVLGLDLGTKTIGLALSDVERIVATPYKSLSRKKFSLNAKELKVITKSENVGALIIGLPMNMDGSFGPAAQSIKDYSKQLAHEDFALISLWDERLSTVAVEKIMIQADLSRKRRSQIVDKLAATFILQGALDLMSTNNT
tara:strand:- start:42484 stop:42954 length:471 start_codon:yes stop_codon:yes gene_type:complete